LENWSKVEYACLRYLKCQLSELDRLEFWRAEMLFENHKEAVEEENRKNKTQQESQQMPSMGQAVGDLVKSTGGKFPGFGGGGMPKLPF
jgi:hypothetical protein